MKSVTINTERAPRPPSQRGEVLVAVMNNVADWQIVREQLWYRVPVETAPRRWPPKWLAFYQTKIFRDEAFSIRYYGKVVDIHRVHRHDLFPDEAPNPKSEREYFQVFLERLEQRPTPIVSYRLRLIVFIPTTWRKLMTAVEINDLFDDSTLEDALWEEMRKLQMRAERQFYIKHKRETYCLDFALFCQNGNLDVETDGDRWHADPARIPEDNRRNNALAAQGYQVLRFNTMQVREEMAKYCVPKIVETVKRLGGVQDPHGAPRVYYPTDDGLVQQLTLFERSAQYTVESNEE